MAAVPVQIDGVLWDHASKSGRKVSLIGNATLVGLTVGGGPIVPPEGAEPPLGMWGPNDPRPTPPIYHPGDKPPGMWGPNDPRPTPPIYMPKPPPEYPNAPEGDKPPPPEGGWGYVSDHGYGWGYFPAQADKPHPPQDPNAPVVNPL